MGCTWAQYATSMYSCTQCAVAKKLFITAVLLHVDVSSRIRGRAEDLTRMATTNLVQNLPVFVFDLVCEILEEFEDLLKLARVNTEIRGLVHDRLRVLRVYHCENLTSLHLLTPFTALTSLRALRLGSCSSLEDVGALASCTKLTSLDLSGCDRLTDVSALASCTALTSLDLRFCRRLTDVSALESLHLDLNSGR